MALPIIDQHMYDYGDMLLVLTVTYQPNDQGQCMLLLSFFCNGVHMHSSLDSVTYRHTRHTPTNSNANTVTVNSDTDTVIDQ